MNINDVSMSLSNKNKEWLKRFFEFSRDYMATNNLYNYEALKKFTDSYEEFLHSNKLDNNDYLKLFLAELRFEQLSFKLTDNTPKMKMNKGSYNCSCIHSTPVIDKWMLECFGIEEKQVFVKKH